MQKIKKILFGILILLVLVVAPGCKSVSNSLNSDKKAEDAVSQTNPNNNSEAPNLGDNSLRPHPKIPKIPDATKEGTSGLSNKYETGQGIFGRSSDTPQNLGNDKGANPDNIIGFDGNECIKSCDTLTSVEKSNCLRKCWTTIANGSDDATVCEVKSPQNSDELKATIDELSSVDCYMTFAATKVDQKYCDEIGQDSSDTLRGGCYGAIAEIKKDPSVCEGIKGSMMYDLCLSDAKGK